MFLLYIKMLKDLFCYSPTQNISDFQSGHRARPSRTNENKVQSSGANENRDAIFRSQWESRNSYSCLVANSYRIVLQKQRNCQSHLHLKSHHLIGSPQNRELWLVHTPHPQFYLKAVLSFQFSPHKQRDRFLFIYLRISLLRAPLKFVLFWV